MEPKEPPVGKPPGMNFQELENTLGSRQAINVQVYRWRYAFEMGGFTAQQAKNLAFLMWLYRSGRLNEQYDAQNTYQHESDSWVGSIRENRIILNSLSTF